MFISTASKSSKEYLMGVRPVVKFGQKATSFDQPNSTQTGTDERPIVGQANYVLELELF